MTSFPTRARRVRDPGLSSQQRLYALRECTLRCAPYGFRATWHHLIISGRVPRHLDDDPDALVRAVDELEQAREVLLPHAQAYTVRRRTEHAAGERVPKGPAPWNSWGACQIAYCPDPEHHPTAPLAAVVRRVLASHGAGVDPAAQCLACGTERRRRNRPCLVCGVHPEGPVARWRDPSEEERWRRIWRRDPTG